jgi:tetratricopeptide (TPR) repeat protein
MAGQLERDGTRQVVIHLLAGCDACRETTGALWNAQEAALRPDRLSEARALKASGSYDAAISKAFERAVDLATRLETERREAPALADLLAQHPAARQTTLVANGTRFQTKGLSEELLTRAYASRFDDPRRTLDLARLADEVAVQLDSSVYGRAALHDLRAQTLSHVGNALRILGEPPAADAALAEATLELRLGSGQAGVRAQIHAFRGELRRAQARFPEALRLFDRAVRLYLSIGSTREAGTWLIGKAVTQGYSGYPEMAVTTLREALTLIEPSGDLRLLLAARHNLVLFLLECGNTLEAQCQLERLQPLYRRTCDRMNLVRLRWLEAKIHAAAERPAQAELAYREVRDAYVSQAMPYDAAVASLELAAFYAQAGRTHAVKELAAETLPIFQAVGVHREAIAALLIFQQAAEMEAVSLGLLKELAAYFEKASKNPALPFRST